MCNNLASHVVMLASVCSKVAQELNGLIVLGNLPALTDSISVLKSEGHIVDENFDYGYMVEPKFLNYWLGERDFRLEK